ncbi:hypothetical protein HanIR_Chr09g0423551 [Helianthus annuus]|nr:hypothetical protein HanIR_Chr09g0423551 [Helianthus annuus]
MLHLFSPMDFPASSIFFTNPNVVEPVKLKKKNQKERLCYTRSRHNRSSSSI